LARGKEAMSATRDPGRQFRENHEGLVVALAAGKPVATWNINTFLEADFYLNSEELSRLHYVVPEQELGRKYRFQDLNSYVAPLLGRIAPLRARVTPWSQFEHVGPFLWHEEGIPSWWEEALVGWKKRVDFRHDGEYVWAVERP